MWLLYRHTVLLGKGLYEELVSGDAEKKKPETVIITVFRYLIVR